MAASATTFGIITDIHGNRYALEEALKRLQRRNLDQIICLGDCFSLGSSPVEVLGLLKNLDNAIFIRGNHDRYLVEGIWEYDRPTVEGMDPDDPICINVIANQAWTAAQIKDEGLNFIRKMRLSHLVNIGGTNLEFTHAWFGRDEMPPSLEEAKVWRDHEMKRYPAAVRFVLVHGHTHIPRNEQFGNLRIFCPGSTGLPFDEDHRGVVAFLTVNGDDIQWEMERFEYDTQAAIDHMEKIQPPFYRNLSTTLKYASVRNDLVD